MLRTVLCVGLLGLLLSVTAQIINPPQRAQCDSGTCCSGLWFQRPFYLFWQGPIHLFDTDECRDEEGSACARPVGEECDVVNNESDCQLHAQCCWIRHWRNNQLGDQMPDEAEGVTWGDYLCARINNTEFGPISAPWQVELQGKWYHCARGLTENGVWELYPEIPEASNVTVPQLCCKRGGLWEPDCPGEGEPPEGW